MAVTSASIILRWPALSQIAGTTELDAAIAAAALELDQATWGTFYDVGLTHLAAHQLMVSHPEIQGPGMVGPGPISAESVGEVSRSYAVQAVSREGGYRATAPGREFQRLMRLLGLGVMVV